MPSAAQHNAKYQANCALLDTGFAAVDPAWAAVVAFYAAVHLVERLGALEKRPIHHDNHKDCNSYVYRAHRPIALHYDTLFDASTTSRYGTINQFQSQFTAATVQSQIIDTHLVAIEQYVANLLAPPPPPTLPQPPSAAAGS